MIELPVVFEPLSRYILTLVRDYLNEHYIAFK